MRTQESRRFRRIIEIEMMALAMLIQLIVPASGLSQTDRGRIAGIVRDQHKSVVPGATVIVRNEATGEERSVTADEQGSYAVANLRPAVYTLVARAQGFSDAQLTGIQLLVGQALNTDLEIRPAGTSETVTILATEEAGIDATSARIGANVNPREVQELPLNGRQLSQLYLQAPGTVNSGSGTYGDIRFSGRAVQQNALRYDGVEGSAIIDGSPGNLNGEIASPFRLQASLETVQEFRADSNSYPAEYGTGTGGQVSVVTKSGTNNFHGSMFEYFRNNKLDARNFFDRDFKSPLRLNQFGASVGGPIIKDKLFIFGSYEGYRLRSGINIVEGVPKLSRCASAVPAVRPLCENGFLSAGATRTVTNPLTSPDFDIGQLVASNPVNENSGAARFDYRANPNNTFYARFFRDQGDNVQPQNVSGALAIYRVQPQNGVFAWQRTISVTSVNEFKLGYNSAYSRVAGSAPTVNGIDLSATTINITGSVALQNIPGQGNSAGISIPGGLFRLNSATNGRAAPYTPYTIGLIDNYSWLHGTHALKFGGEVRFLRLYTDRLGGTTYTYSNLANFLTNTASSVQYNGDVSAPSPFNNGAASNRLAKEEFYIAYAQDEWKIRQNLTLNYGLRYEYYTPLREDKDRQVVFDIDRGLILPSDSEIYKAVKTNFAPRISLAWSPRPASSGFFGGGRTVIRAGFGINYGPGQIEDQIQPIESDRIASTVSNVANAFPANIPTIVANFIANPNNRNFQPRAYDRENYSVPERVFSYTGSIEQELPYKMVLTVAYVGSQGRNLFLRSVANQIIAVRTNANPANAAIVIREFSLATENGPGTNPTVLNPFAEVDYKRSGGHDSYNALQMALGRRFNSGLTLNAQYTFGRSMGNTAGSNEALTAGNIARKTADFDYDDGYNNFDVRHTFNLSGVYSLPWGKGLSGLGRALAGGWDIGTILNARSGLPIPVQITRPDILYVDAAGIYYGSPAPGRTAVINTPGGGNSRNVRRPDLLPGVNPFLNKDRAILNPAAFAIPKPGTYGNLVRNQIHGPNFVQQDLIVSKKFGISESMNVQFRAEIFNIFNVTNFANPPAQLPNTYGSGLTLQPGQPFTAALAGSAFGVVNRTVERSVGLGTNRQIQFALRFNF